MRPSIHFLKILTAFAIFVLHYVIVVAPWDSRESITFRSVTRNERRGTESHDTVFDFDRLCGRCVGIRCRLRRTVASGDLAWLLLRCDADDGLWPNAPDVDGTRADDDDDDEIGRSILICPWYASSADTGALFRWISRVAQSPVCYAPSW